jgi:hypothetical protein
LDDGVVSNKGKVRVGRPVADAAGRSRFGLAGVSHSYDPRTVAIRPDLADIAVAGQHFAPHYAAPMMRSVRVATPLRATSAGDGEPLGELLPGQGFALLDVTGDVAWGYRLSDHLVGYCPAAALGTPIAPTHRIAAAEAPIFAAANVDSVHVTTFPAGALVMGSASGDWLETPHGWMRLSDLEELPATNGAG